jgi:tRNA(Ile)-lysidine synthetase-like protein
MEVLPVAAGGTTEEATPEYIVAIPGEVTAAAFGLRLRIDVDSSATLEADDESQVGGRSQGGVPSGAKAHVDSVASAARLKSCPDTRQSISAARFDRVATLRNWRAGDRVRLRYSNGPRKVKEVLERLRVTGTSRALWPVLEVDGRIVWMKGVELEPTAGVRVVATRLEGAGG